jgi:hypothetical protein
MIIAEVSAQFDQAFVLSGPSGVILYHPVWFAARLQTNPGN